MDVAPRGRGNARDGELVVVARAGRVDDAFIAAVKPPPLGTPSTTTEISCRTCSQTVKQVWNYSRIRSLPSALSLFLGDLPQSGAGASRRRVHPCAPPRDGVIRIAYDAASETFAYSPIAQTTAVATKVRVYAANVAGEPSSNARANRHSR